MDFEPFVEASDELLENDFALIDMTETITVAMGKKIKSVKNCFDNRFLSHLRAHNEKYTALTFDEIPKEHFDKALFGLFSSFLLGKVGWQTACGYLSGLKAIICHKFGDDATFTLFQGGQAVWYTALRTELLKKYKSLHRANNTKLTKGSPKMKEEDLRIMCTMLFSEHSDSNVRLSAVNRCLMVYQWQLLGRISELQELTMSDITFDSDRFHTCIKINMDRMKTSSQHDVHIFPHATDWVICPFHSLAALLVMSTPSGRLFDVPNLSMAAHVNSLLHDLAAEWEAYKNTHDCSQLEAAITEALTSHSARSGCATFLNCHPGLLLQWLVLRGGWAVNHALTIFAYIAGIACFNCALIFSADC